MEARLDYREQLIAEEFSEAFLRWEPSLPMFESLDTQSLGKLADEHIDAYWDRVAKRERILFEPLWFRDPIDAWATRDQIIAAASRLAQSNADITALEILLRFGQYDYLPLACRALDDWLEHGGFDFEGWLGLIASTYPNHAATREYVEKPHNVPHGLIDLLPTSAAPVIRDAGEWIRIDRFDRGCDEWTSTANLLVALGPARAKVALTTDELSTIKAGLEEYAQKRYSATPDLYLEHISFLLNDGAVMKAAAAMGWEDLAATMASNPQYIARLFFTTATDLPGLERHMYWNMRETWTHDLLAWSWMSPDSQFTARLAAKALSLARGKPPPYCDRCHGALSAAIAWKRFAQAALPQRT